MENPRSILFVCRANERRSITAEFVFNQLLAEAGLECSEKPDKNKVYVDSAGINTNPQYYNTKQMTKELGDLAEKIITFNRNLEIAIIEIYHQDPKKIININVTDRWPPCHPKLIEELREKLLPYFKQWYGE